MTEHIRQQCDESLMPMEEEDLKSFIESIITNSNKRLAEKLSDISDVGNLVELRVEFEKRIRSYFKIILENNVNESRTFCLNLLHNLHQSLQSEMRINDVSDI
mmetsp:Transcript_16600/g.15884  ORF Transcript_16600/g.15884 Transcript_16600/m.15884 type:complete len:103 (+) Transcript_16600:120-428(+)